MESTDSLREREVASGPDTDTDTVSVKDIVTDIDLATATEQAISLQPLQSPTSLPELTVEQVRARGAFDDLLAAPTVTTIQPTSASGAALSAEVASLTDEREPVFVGGTRAVAEAGIEAGTDRTVAPVFDFSERPTRVRVHTTGVDWATLVLAVIAPPVGLVASIAVRVFSYRKNGWTSGVARTATVVSVIMTALLAVVVTVGLNLAAADAAYAARASASAPLCGELQGTDGEPGVLEQPGFGWPVERTAIPETLIAMKDYQARWTALAELAPPFETGAVRAVADAAGTLVNEVESSRTIDRAANLDRMSTITAQSTLPQWFADYCN
jgi:hypothetical protein